jgi:hypothetical protein
LPNELLPVVPDSSKRLVSDTMSVRGVHTRDIQGPYAERVRDFGHQHGCLSGGIGHRLCTGIALAHVGRCHMLNRVGQHPDRYPVRSTKMMPSLGVRARGTERR